MNDAVRVSTDGLLTNAELAARPDFTLGLAAVSPSTRTIAGPGGTTDVEPRVMQVLVVLADGAGQVVTRETLFRRCWGGVYVGDDSLNRAIAAVRKLAADIAGGSFAIETIPRTGYRITGATVETVARSGADEAQSSRGLSRRQLAGGAAGVIALGGIGWSVLTSRSDAHFNALIKESQAAVRNYSAFGDERTIGKLQTAISLRPESAKAWGLLALVKSMRAVGAPPNQSERKIEDAENTARRALAIDPKEPNALLAMFELQGSTLDWITRDQRLRQIIAIDPRNMMAITELVALLQAAGLTGESWRWNEHAILLEPLSPDLLGRRALKLWIIGRLSDADKVIDQVRELYPSDQWAWWVRFLILALTDRARAARAMLDADPAMLSTPAEAALWRTCLAALEHSPGSIAVARRACLDAATKAGQLAAQGVMVLSSLGEVDAAFDVASGFLLWRGSVVRRGRSILRRSGPDGSWRIGVQWLFTPPCAVLRSDPRFLPLCDGVGLVEYWRLRGVRPDYQLIGR